MAGPRPLRRPSLFFRFRGRTWFRFLFDAANLLRVVHLYTFTNSVRLSNALYNYLCRAAESCPEPLIPASALLAAFRSKRGAILLFCRRSGSMRTASGRAMNWCSCSVMQETLSFGLRSIQTGRPRDLLEN